jgi:hypothetical protein
MAYCTFAGTRARGILWRIVIAMRAFLLDDGSAVCIVEEEGFVEAELFASLETALRGYPSGQEWLALIREGYTGEEARRRLGLSRRWLAGARELCRIAFRDGLSQD